MLRSSLLRTKPKVRLEVVYTDAGCVVTLTTWNMFWDLSEGIFPLVAITSENEAPGNRRCIITAQDYPIAAMSIQDLIGCFGKNDRAEVGTYIMAMRRNKPSAGHYDIAADVTTLERNLGRLMANVPPGV